MATQCGLGIWPKWSVRDNFNYYSYFDTSWTYINRRHTKAVLSMALVSIMLVAIS
jgi:hypothetical protein